MRYWWVNQNQTYRHEVPGGFLWSPKRKADGRRNPFYEVASLASTSRSIYERVTASLGAIAIMKSG